MIFVQFIILTSFNICIFCGASASSNSILNDVLSEDIPPPKTPKPSKHHKVHGLILNPDQHSWCELKEIKQIVTHANCESQEMANFVCVGTCFSYSVPQTEPEIPGDEMLDYCDSCQPAESYWTTVVLNCEDEGSEYQVTKNIQKITNCSCSPCKPTRKSSLNNDVRQTEHRTSDLIYKMLPDSHPLSSLSDEHASILDDHRYSMVSLLDLKKEFNLDSIQENMLSGKLLMKDVASFTDDEDQTDPLRTHLSN
ncbi:UNVERIFIED_CONTAM: hypothetical protein RMT77_007100 [Armadillidium vulgare]